MQGEKAGNAYLTSIRRYQKLWEQIGNKMGTRWEQDGNNIYIFMN